MRDQTSGKWILMGNCVPLIIFPQAQSDIIRIMSGKNHINCERQKIATSWLLRLYEYEYSFSDRIDLIAVTRSEESWVAQGISLHLSVSGFPHLSWPGTSLVTSPCNGRRGESGPHTERGRGEMGRNRFVNTWARYGDEFIGLLNSFSSL